MEEAPHAPRVGAGAGAAPHPEPTTPTSQRLPPTPPSKHTGWARLVIGKQYGIIWATGHGSPPCPFECHLRVLSAHFHFHHFNKFQGHTPQQQQAGQRAGRTHGPIFVFQSLQLAVDSCFIAPVLDIPNGFLPLDRAVGRAYIRETVPTSTTMRHAPSGTTPHMANGHWRS
jgi:hypothetical protein